MSIISVLNQKGGVGKTTTVINLGRSLNELGYKVLLIDLDAQTNCTLGLDKRNKEYNINTCIRQEISLEQAIEQIREGFDIVAADLRLAEIELFMFAQDRREYILKELIDPVKEQYDFILLDCSPSLNLMSLNALTASDYILIPTEQSQFAVEGMANLIEFIKRVRKINPELNILGVLLTLLDRRENITYSVKKELEAVFGQVLFDTFISRDANIKKSQIRAKALMDCYKESRATEQYMDVAGEVVKRVEG